MASTNRKAGLWHEIERNGETIWLHPTAPVWVVYYAAIEASQFFRHAFYQPYVAIEPVKKGRAVWAHNNKRVGREGEFKTLAAAKSAADEFVQANSKETK